MLFIDWRAHSAYSFQQTVASSPDTCVHNAFEPLSQYLRPISDAETEMTITIAHDIMLLSASVAYSLA